MAHDAAQDARDVALARLSKSFALVEAWQKRIHAQQPPPEPGSSLAGDDKATDPYNLSHAVVEVLLSAVDHLETLRLVVQEQQTLPARGGFTLVRAVLENAAVAVWLLAPASRDERVFRLLRWEWADAEDSDSALLLMAEMATDPTRSAEVRQNAADQRDKRKQSLQKLAQDRHLSQNQVSQVCARPVKWADILKGAGDAARELTGDRAKWAWMICSGLAHSRRWAVIGFLKYEVTPGPTADLHHLKVSADEERLAIMVNIAVLMLAEAWRLFDERRRSLMGS
ncbi:hypothetical protein [Actinokineospora bangkokensis]|uniref:Uncharacterized protein n=1 Tax=Actinokineospora bangkokensis TaxID=1193682 RepID=A0A1Q9LKK2_9PSEU|nr:hypothetical protein [Actinokineospora bangkokensis]OLR92562.1 hypothetical protein BJP25_21125 [Actinokineospora bangkokensis]